MYRQITFIAFTFLAVFFSGCGDSNTPDSKTVINELNKNLRGVLSATSVELERTGQEGNIGTYSVSGKLALAQNIYSEVAYLSGKQVLALVGKKGNDTPFSATLEAIGNKKTGWQLRFSGLTFDRNIVNGEWGEKDIAARPGNFLIANSDELEDEIEKLRKGLKAKMEAYKQRPEVNVEALKRTTQEEINKLRTENEQKQRAIAEEREKWRRDFHQNDPTVKAFDENKQQWRITRQAVREETDKIRNPMSQARSKAIWRNQKKATLPDGSQLTIEELDKKSKEIYQASKEKIEQIDKEFGDKEKLLRQKREEAFSAQGAEFDKRQKESTRIMEEKTAVLRMKLEAETAAQNEAAQAKLDFEKLERIVEKLKKNGYL